MSEPNSISPRPRRALLEERVRRRMSVAEFAELLGVDDKTVRRLERGEPANPKTLYRVSDALALDPLVLFGVDEFATGNGHAPAPARAA